MALFITLGLISRPSAKMLSLAQHADYAQYLSMYAVSCTVGTRFVDPSPPFLFLVFVFLEMGLYRSRIEFLVMFEVV
jgi:hypothetical protein